MSHSCHNHTQTSRATMAPPSKTTKKTIPVSSKVKVHRQSHPRPCSTPLPSDWPVASQPPQFSSEQSALTPGSLLQELCSGQDIHINKQALLPPSIPKEKGRYLLILPGQFSFKPLKPNAPTSTTTSGDSTVDAKEEALPVLTQTQESEDPIKPPSPNEGNTNQEESDEDNEAPVGQESTAPTTQNKPTVPQFGTLEGLTTPHPKLRISFPTLQKSLVFPGSKVHTSSKYMWLNCAARKKGTVACKVRRCRKWLSDQCRVVFLFRSRLAHLCVHIVDYREYFRQP